MTYRVDVGKTEDLLVVNAWIQAEDDSLGCEHGNLLGSPNTLKVGLADSSVTMLKAKVTWVSDNIALL